MWTLQFPRSHCTTSHEVTDDWPTEKLRFPPTESTRWHRLVWPDLYSIYVLGLCGSQGSAGARLLCGRENSGEVLVLWLLIPGDFPGRGLEDKQPVLTCIEEGVTSSMQPHAPEVSERKIKQNTAKSKSSHWVCRNGHSIFRPVVSLKGCVVHTYFWSKIYLKVHTHYLNSVDSNPSSISGPGLSGIF